MFTTFVIFDMCSILSILLVLQDAEFTNDFVQEEDSPWVVWGERRLVKSVPYKLVDAKLLEAFPQKTTKTAAGVSSPWVALISYSDVSGTKMAASCLVPLEKIWVLVGEGLVEEQNLEKGANK
jgi:hypothetical protein